MKIRQIINNTGNPTCTILYVLVSVFLYRADGSDNDADLIQWPESPVMVSNTEAIIEAFWNPALASASRWSVRDKNNVSKPILTPYWDRLQLDWNATSASGEAVIERDFDLHVDGFESLILRAQIPTDVMASASVIVDGKEQNIFSGRYGAISHLEIEGGLEGKHLEKIVIRFAASTPGQKIVKLRWIMLGKKGLAWVGPIPDYNRYISSDSGKPFEPGLALLHNAKDIEYLRVITAQPEFTNIWQKDLDAITELLSAATDFPVRRYTLYAPDRYGRVDDVRTGEFNLALQAALAGLVSKNETMMRFAAEGAIRLALTEQWAEGLVSHMPGSTWRHSAFAENIGTIQAALLLDFCWHRLTAEGRALIGQAIREKGLPRLKEHRDAYANQGVRFHKGLLLGQLALAKARLGAPMSAQEIQFEIDSMNGLLEPLIREDGTYPEGLGYGLGTLTSTLLTYHVASKELGKPIKDLVDTDILAGLRFAVEMQEDLPEVVALFGSGPLQGIDFKRYANPISLLQPPKQYSNLPEMWGFGVDWLWYRDTLRQENADVGGFPRFSLYPDGGWIFARDDSANDAIKISFESGLWSGHGHSWMHKNSLTLDAWGQALLFTRKHVSYGDGRYFQTSRTAAYNTFSPGGRNQDARGTLGRGSVLRAAQDLPHTTVMEADNATAWKEGVELARRRVLFIRPHVILIEDTLQLEGEETGVQSWNSLMPFEKTGTHTAKLSTDSGNVLISLLNPQTTLMETRKDSVHRNRKRSSETGNSTKIVPVFQTVFTSSPSKQHVQLTVISLHPSAATLHELPKIRVTGKNGRLIKIIQGDSVTRIVPTTAYHKSDLWGVETDGSFTFATMKNNELVEAGAFDANFIKFKDITNRGNGFLFLENP